MTLTLHSHPFASYCWKVLIALYERDLPFVQKRSRAGTIAPELWPFATMPVLVDSAHGVSVAESRIVIEYLDRLGDAAPLIPAEPDAALQARLWDRAMDGQVHTPMQIVLDNLCPEGSRDRYDVKEGKTNLDVIYPILDTRAYLKAKPAEGKTRRDAISYLKRHLSRRIWRLLYTPQTPTALPTPALMKHQCSGAKCRSAPSGRSTSAQTRALL